MTKTLALGLNDFPAIPTGLRRPANANEAIEAVHVNLFDLFNHFYQDAHGDDAGGGAAALALYQRMIVPDTAFCFRADGPGTHKEVRIGEYNKFGKAFCRWFLHEHCNINYFAHLDQVLGRQMDAQFGGLVIHRDAEGDTPDYFCSSDVRGFFLAEAKGTGKRISFTHAKFRHWREQFDRVRCEQNGVQIAIKGYIVATRLVCENTRDGRNGSMLLAEDPNTKGDDYKDYDGSGVAQVTVSEHYAAVLDMIRLPLLAAALRTNTKLPADHKVRVGVWEGMVPPVAGKRFVGGFIPAPGVSCEEVSLQLWRGFRPYTDAPLCLTRPEVNFFGVELGIFKLLRAVTLQGREMITETRPLDVEHGITHLSLLRDGTTFAPLEYFQLSEIEEF